MDIKKEIEEAYKELIEKYSSYIKAETELANQLDGFFDKSYLDKMVEARAEWQLSSNKFYNLLVLINKK